MAILKRQLEEKEKLLATEQEDASVAKSKLRELNKVGPTRLPTSLPYPISRRGEFQGCLRKLYWGSTGL